MLPEPHSLYIHVPFCRSRCGYCSFFTCAGTDWGLQRRWLDHVLEEWFLWQGLFKERGAGTVYIGGGTPSSLALDLWEELLGSLDLNSLRPDGVSQERFATVEVNPGTLSRELLGLFNAGGVGRLSMGVQSFDPRVLKASGRKVSPQELETSLELLKSEWTGQVSLDLILGLPGQDRKSITNDLDRALAWDPGHLSLYEYMREPGTPLDLQIQKGLKLPSEDRRQKWWLEARERLESAGYSNYEISNFARPGKESLHNLVYWSGRPYIGLGPGAHSFYHWGTRWIRRENPEVWEWPGGKEPWGPPVTEVLTPEELVKDLLLSALRTRTGLEISRFQDMTGLPGSWLREGVSPEDRGWYREEGGFWKLTEEGRDRMDWLLRRYDFDRV